MINFNDSSIIISYIQNFLKNNFNNEIIISGIYDTVTHQNLIKYVQLPEIVNSLKMKDTLLDIFTTYEDDKSLSNSIYNFDFDITDNTITFFTRPVTECFVNGTKFIQNNTVALKIICEKNGWLLRSFNISLKNKRSEFTIIKENRKQLLPTKDIIKMINFSTNEYFLGKCFVDENNTYHGFIQNSNKYKILYIPAKPGDVFTISHGYKYACELAIGYTDSTLSELKHDDITYVNNIISHLSKSKYGELNPNNYEIYKIPNESNCKYLLIQLPYNNLISPISQKITVKLGDINQDGKITINTNDENSDYMMLKRYVNAKTSGEKLPFILSGTNLIAANLNKDVDVNGNPIIDEADLKLFENKIKDFNNLGQNIDFGEVIYEKEVDLSETDNDKILVMYGDIEEENLNNELNIPIYEFQEKPWAVHEAFIPYILDSVIHKYSNQNDIVWLQRLIQEINPSYKMLTWGVYDDSSMFKSNDYFQWNELKNQYEYFQNGSYTNYILDKNDLYNANFIREIGRELSNMKIVNGRILVNNVWTGKLVLEDGSITKEISKNSLKEIIKEFQIKTNKHYENQTSEQIKFINGYVDPITEKRLKALIINNE